MADQEYELETEYPDEIRNFKQLPNDTWYEAWLRMRYVVDKSTTNNAFVGELVNIYLCGRNDKSYEILDEGIVGMNTNEVFYFIEEFIHYNEFVYERRNETIWQEEYDTAEDNETTEAYGHLENESHTQPPESQKYPEIHDSNQIMNTDAMEEPHVSLPQSDFGEVIMAELKKNSWNQERVLVR